MKVVNSLREIPKNVGTADTDWVRPIRPILGGWTQTSQTRLEMATSFKRPG